MGGGIRVEVTVAGVIPHVCDSPIASSRRLEVPVGISLHCTVAGHSVEGETHSTDKSTDGAEKTFSRRTASCGRSK